MLNSEVGFRKQFVLFLFAFSFIIGPAYNSYLHFDALENVDTLTYLHVGEGKFEGESLTRRYRVIVPAMAAVVAWPIQKVYTRLWPHRPDEKWPLRLAFYLVNCIITAMAGVFLYRICLLYGASLVSAFVAMAAVLSGRWVNYIAGTPMTDSLYLLVICMVIYAIKAKDKRLLIFSIFIGPFAKESFIFIAPIVFFFGPVHKGRQVVYFLLSGIIVFGARYYIDQLAGTADATASLQNDTGHLGYINGALQKILNPRGVGELLTVMGTFTFMMLAGYMGGRLERKKWTQAIDLPIYLLLLSLVVHSLLSGQVARMLLYGGAAWAIILALVLDRHKYFAAYRRLLGLPEYSRENT